MYKIAVVGDYDSIYGFATLGLDIFPVTSRKEAEEKLEHLAASKYGIIWYSYDFTMPGIIKSIDHKTVYRSRKNIVFAIFL